ncbi:MAG: hypothetical protein ACRD1T_02020 [Acidimicrobiia bacterium]
MTPLEAARAQTIQDSLKSVRGVREARVELGEEGVRAVRVLVAPELQHPGLVDELRDKIVARCGVDVSADAIEILTTAGPQGSGLRRKLASLLTERTHDRFTARVTLEAAGDIVMGEGSSAAGPRFERRSVASATLNGLGNLIEGPVEIEKVSILNGADEQVALVVITTGEASLVGAAVIRHDEYDAIARATLDAVNRLVARSE